MAEDGTSVELQLIEEQIKELFQFKILLLGAGESGKSTIVKQMRLIHKKKQTPKELALIGTSLHQNLVDCMKALVNAVDNMGYELPEECAPAAEMVRQHPESTRLNPEEGQLILELWNSEAVQQAYARRSEFWLLDSFPYYIENIEKFCDEDFVPDTDDTVMARIRTTGIVVTKLEQRIAQEHEHEPDKLEFQVVDVGGQRNERKKWMHCFDDVRAILFVVNLAGYNQVLFEDASKNRMKESLELFGKVVKNQLFKDTPTFLFLNKKDLFEAMIKESPLKNTFPDYEGGAETQAALEFIKQEFQKRLPPGKDVNIEYVSASWRRDIRCSFEEVKKALYDINRKDLLAKVGQLRKNQKQIEADAAKKAKGGGCCTIQ